MDSLELIESIKQTNASLSPEEKYAILFYSISFLPENKVLCCS